MILFPLGDPIFEDLGPDGISMFYVSCIVSQLVFSLGGSTFNGAIGSEMVRDIAVIIIGELTASDRNCSILSSNGIDNHYLHWT